MNHPLDPESLARRLRAAAAAFRPPVPADLVVRLQARLAVAPPPRRARRWLRLRRLRRLLPAGAALAAGLTLVASLRVHTTGGALPPLPPAAPAATFPPSWQALRTTAAEQANAWWSALPPAPSLDGELQRLQADTAAAGRFLLRCLNLEEG